MTGPAALRSPPGRLVDRWVLGGCDWEGVPVTTPRLYVARDDRVLVVSRHQLRTVGGTTARRPWAALVETSSATPDPEPPRSIAGAATVALPPIVLFWVLFALGADRTIAVLAALGMFFVAAYASPIVRRRVSARKARRAALGGTSLGVLGAGSSAADPSVAGSDRSRLLFDVEERAVFERALDTTDRISATWPALGALVDTFDADILLGQALWDLSGVLVRRQQVRRVLTDLDRPEYADLPADSAAIREFTEHRDNARRLLAAADAEIVRREQSLFAAERAGRDFITEQELRRAVRDAARSLQGLEPAADEPVPDSGGELAERTESVLAAYRQLTGDSF